MGKEFLEMQQEASRRLREMQRRSAPTMPPPSEKKTEPAHALPEPKRKGALSLFQAFDFSKLSRDGDGLILLVLLLLLSEEETDELLILALFYVMM